MVTLCCFQKPVQRRGSKNRLIRIKPVIRTQPRYVVQAEERHAFPIRETRDPFPVSWSETGRISECYVQIGHLQIRIITTYGFAKGTPNGLSMTNFLLEAAGQRLLTNHDYWGRPQSPS